MQTLTAALISLLLLSADAAQPSASATNLAQAHNLEELAKAIAEGKGRPVYDAFMAIPKEAQNPDQQARAFDVIFPFLTSTKTCVVKNFYRPGSHVTSNTFLYAELAGDTIAKLGNPARKGLARGLSPPETILAERCAILLCKIQGSALYAKGGPREKDSPPLDADTRNALEAFLQQRGSSLSVNTLTCFYTAELPAAAGYIHNILKITKDPMEKMRAVIYLGSYGYEPALDDLLEIFKTNADLRSTVREDFPYFIDSDRVTKAIRDIRDGTKDEALKKECETALELVRLKADWRRRHGK